MPATQKTKTIKRSETSSKTPLAAFSTLKLVVKLPHESKKDALEKVYEILNQYEGLLDMKDGKGNIAFDGHGSGSDSNSIEFFFYFSTNASGSRQLRIAYPLLFSAADALQASDYSTIVLADQNAKNRLQ